MLVLCKGSPNSFCPGMTSFDSQQSNIVEGSSIHRLSPTSSRELKDTLAVSDREMLSFSSGGGDDGEPLESSEEAKLDGEALLVLKRKRNAFHSRKKRQRKKDFVKRLQACYGRIFSENNRLKEEQKFLEVRLSESLRIIGNYEMAKACSSLDNSRLAAQLQHSSSKRSLVTGPTDYLERSLLAQREAERTRSALSSIALRGNGAYVGGHTNGNLARPTIPDHVTFHRQPVESSHRASLIDLALSNRAVQQNLVRKALYGTQDLNQLSLSRVPVHLSLPIYSTTNEYSSPQRLTLLEQELNRQERMNSAVFQQQNLLHQQAYSTARAGLGSLPSLASFDYSRLPMASLLDGQTLGSRRELSNMSAPAGPNNPADALVFREQMLQGQIQAPVPSPLTKKPRLS